MHARQPSLAAPAAAPFAGLANKATELLHLARTERAAFQQPQRTKVRQARWIMLKLVGAEFASIVVLGDNEELATQFADFNSQFW